MSNEEVVALFCSPNEGKIEKAFGSTNEGKKDIGG